LATDSAGGAVPELRQTVARSGSRGPQREWSAGAGVRRHRSGPTGRARGAGAGAGRKWEEASGLGRRGSAWTTRLR
jgi:hypothetical protein